MSCGIASSRMVIETETGNNVSEAALRTQSANDPPGGYDAMNGTRTDNMERLLRANGVSNARNRSGQNLDNIASATSSGHPAIVNVSNPYPHHLVVDEVRRNPDGTRTLIVRDPWCGGGPSASDSARGRQEMSEADFNNRAPTGWVVTTNP
ncbi:MAG TPA: hypothetical protein VGB17_17495 [Pyrinomonadaceae bacterium]